MPATRNEPLQLEIGDRNELPVDAGVQLFQGAMAFDDGAGRATSVLGAKFLGHVAAEADNRTGGNGAISVLLHAGRYRAQVLLSGVALTHTGAQVFASDNNTLALTSNGGANTLVGLVKRYVAADTAIVEFMPVHETVATVVQQAHIADCSAVSDPPTQAEVNAIVTKLNTLLAQLEAAGVNASA